MLCHFSFQLPDTGLVRQAHLYPITHLEITKGIKRMDVNKKTLKDQNQTFTYPIDLNILNFLRDSKTFCDVTIVIDSQEFPAHKVNFKS